MKVFANINAMRVSSLDKKYNTCPVNKHIYHKQILSKMELLDEKIHLTLSQCNSPPNNTLDQNTCSLLWNDIEDLSRNMYNMEEDLNLVETAIKNESKMNFLKWFNFLKKYRVY
jgi:hypothetical protein